MDDLRVWLKKAQEIKQIDQVDGADWDLEIGTITALNWRKKEYHALVFDNIKGYPAGSRVLTSSTSNAPLVALTFNLPPGASGLELIEVLRPKLQEWEHNSPNYDYQYVKTGAIMENVLEGDRIDLLKFPVPKWHELDGGRYIGTGDAVITRDPDNDEINLGTYRIMVQDKNTTALYISPGKHGRVHYEKYHARGQPCPVVISVGHHPALFRVANMALRPGSEYNYIGAVFGEPVKVIKEEITGLPIPADADIVIAGFSPPGVTRQEGPFGEWTGYYASKDRQAPILDVKRIYHRNNPILVGSPPGRAPSDSSYFRGVTTSAMVFNELSQAGIPDVKGVWMGEAPLVQFIVVSIKQRYAGHAKQAALIATQSRTGAYMGRYTVVVDDDIDPTDLQEVLWAICTRSDPEKDIDIIRRCWSTPLDPTIRKPTNAFYNSRAIIDACKPYEWKDEFPQEITISPELKERVLNKFKDIIK
ncbi:MAG: UbiD family decarboxylase [Dehalococcoidia bacterium]|nr:UbiD family decarboxylase [Dehalococcoidia bacterium]MDZ4245749.1 UbiD family decarboxylase [Dehalococcoidia bacterium]